MTPELLLFGIKSLIRIGQQTNKALIDYAVDQPTTLGDVKVVKLTDTRDLLNKFFKLQRYKYLAKVDPFKAAWDDQLFSGPGIGGNWDGLPADEKTKGYQLALEAARGDGEALAALGADKAGQYAADALTSQIFIGQWKPENKPVSPFGRIALAIVEAGLDYAASDPGIFGAGKSGEKVISAFAIALAKPLTDRLNADTLGTQTQLVNGLMVTLVSAGLGILKERSGDLISDKHLATLVGNVLDPVVAAAKAKDKDVLFQVQLQGIVDALAGPAAQAAMRTIADNPAAFLGKNFDGAKAAGALVSALLVETAKNADVSVTFSENGRLKLLSAALQVVADKPGLFIKAGEKSDAVATLVTDLTSSLATALKEHVIALAGDKEIDGQALAAGVAAAALEAFGRHSDALIGGAGKPWHEVARTVSKDVLGNLVAAIKSPDGAALKQAFSEAKLVELGRIVVESIAAHPEMAGVSDAKSREVISAVARAVTLVTKEKKQLLLTPDDWLELARTMVKEVASRPGIIAGNDAGLQAVVAALGALIAGDKNSVMTGADATAVARTLLTEIVGHPAMLAGLKDDIQRVVLAVVTAMAADKNLLLSGADWVEILKVALSEASANPARLFGMNYNDAHQALAADMIGLVLKTLPTLPAGGAGASAAILKGEVLREATIIVLRYTSGAPLRAKKYQPLLKAALSEVSAFAAKNPGEYGSRQWLRLIDVLMGDILTGKYDAQLALLIANPAAVVTLIPTPKDADALLARPA